MEIIFPSMSFAFCSVHGPTIVTSCAASQQDGTVFLARGNEIVEVSTAGGQWGDAFVRSIFGDIAKIVVIEDTMLTFLVVLLKDGSLYLFDAKGPTFKCVQRSLPPKTVGDRTKPILVAGNHYIFAHTRKRTLTIYKINSAKLLSGSFNVLIPFAEILGITAINGKNGAEFCVLGKDVNGKISVYFYNVVESDVEFLYSIDIEGSAGEVCIAPIDDAEGLVAAVGIGNKIIFIQDEEKQTTMQTGIPEIACIKQISDKMVMVCDSVGIVYTVVIRGMAKMERKSFMISPTEEFVKCTNNYFVQVSKTGDSHLIYLHHKKLTIRDTYAAINPSKCMLRSLFVTKDGKIRAIENGALTAQVANIELRNGTGIWSTDNEIIISTYDQTVVLNNDYTENSEMKIIRDERTIAFYSKDDKIVQITQKHVMRIEGDSVNVKKLDKEVYVAATDGETVAVSYDDTIEVIGDNTIVYNAGEYISALTFGNKCIYAATEKTNKILMCKDGRIEDFFVLPLDVLLITSLVVYRDSEVVAATANGVYVIKDNKSHKIESSHIISKLKMLNNNVFICSDQSGFLKENEKGDFEIDFIGKSSFKSSIDATFIGENIAILSDSGVSLICLERKHHSHITERTIKDMVITCAAIDENDKCPPVFSAISGGKNYLISPKLESAVLPKGEIPIAMLWVIADQSPYLAVLSQKEKSTVVSLYSPTLERCCELALLEKPSAITFVDSEYIAVAHGNVLSIILPVKEEDEGKTKFVLKETSKTPTRTVCASLTSPNSCYVIYADKFSSVVLYSVIDGKITEVSRDMTVRKLRYAAAVSNNQILSIDKEGDAFMLRIEGGVLKTIGAYHLGGKFVAGFSTPPLTLSTESGSVICMLHCTDKELLVYKAMQNTCKDCACKTNSDWRHVTRHMRTTSIDPFIDGDLVMMFDELPEDVKDKIAQTSNLSIEEISNISYSLRERTNTYRIKSQVGFSF